MKRYEVRRAQQRLQVRAFALQVRIVEEDPHPECGRSRRHLLADATEPDQPQGLPRETEDRLSRRHRPLTGAHHAVVERDLARAGEQERHGVLGDLLDAVGRVVGHDDAGGGGGVDVDGVDADSVPRDDLALRHALHHPGRDGAGVRVEERVAIRGFVEELIRRLRAQRHEVGEPLQCFLLHVQGVPHVVRQDDLRSVGHAASFASARFRECHRRSLARHPECGGSRRARRAPSGSLARGRARRGARCCRPAR